ncbi:hypothetical protein Lepto7375DRAFT_0463 [Leptolyngbya sp. PCC 7375]|nr:hypothetical protein Lepto7375DRAFT_0463 [Leptolyngbya sp. PCC 7375]
MYPSRSKISLDVKFPWLIILVGILFTLSLQKYTQGGVFFSGDGGLKALLSQQLAAGNWHFDLRLSAPGWVVELWKQGLYPFTPPYVYERFDNYFITFPFPFPALTSIFYSVLGYWGLYVVPLLALWLIWLRFFQIGQQLKWRADVLAIALSILIFASPLTLYGAMYWEHTLAVSLAFWGITILLGPKGATTSNIQVFLSGSLIGLSVWFRSEFICLAAIVVGFTLWQWVSPKMLSWLPILHGKGHLFISGLLLSMLVFFGLNQMIYGHFLGIHALQVVEESSIRQQLSQAMANYQQLLNALIKYFPFTLWVLTIAVLTGFRKPRYFRYQIITIWLILLLFTLAVPLIIPPGAGGKQWGARFYLILVPLLTLIGGTYLNQVLTCLRGWRYYLTISSLTIVFLAGAYLNVYNGTVANYGDRATASVSLSRNYGPIAPAITAITEHSSPYIAMSHQFVAQQLWVATPEKTFFLTESTSDVQQLADGLYQQGYSQFLYICYPHRACPTPEEPAENLVIFSKKMPLQLKFSSLGTFGKYPVYDVMISKL